MPKENVDTCLHKNPIRIVKWWPYSYMSCPKCNSIVYLKDYFRGRIFLSDYFSNQIPLIIEGAKKYYEQGFL